jgi:hypothetical protein
MRGRDQFSAERRSDKPDRRVDPSSDLASRRHLLPQGEKGEVDLAPAFAVPLAADAADLLHPGSIAGDRGVRLEKAIERDPAWRWRLHAGSGGEGFAAHRRVAGLTGTAHGIAPA